VKYGSKRSFQSIHLKSCIVVHPAIGGWYPLANNDKGDAFYEWLMANKPSIDFILQ